LQRFPGKRALANQAFGHFTKALICSCALFLSSCRETNLPKGKVLSRVISPDGHAIAIITLTEGPATVSDGYRVYVSGTSSDRLIAEVLRMDKGNTPRVVWSNAGLRIEAKCGQIYHFSNFAVIETTAGVQKLPLHLENDGLCA
jgi:hypothetical protein